MDSRKLDRECKEAVEGTIRQNFDGMHLRHDIVKPLAEQYGSDRIAFVLANTIQQESWDGRFSRDNNPQAMEMITELVAKLPEMEIDGNMSEEMEARVWEMLMPDLTPAEQLAVEIDRFIYGYDTALYRDNNQSMTENVSEIAEALKQRDTRDMALWFADIAADGTEPEERKRAMELLGKLAEYKPLAKKAN